MDKLEKGELEILDGFAALIINGLLSDSNIKDTTNGFIKAAYRMAYLMVIERRKYNEG